MDHNPSPPVQLQVGWDGVVATAAVSGELDITNAPALCRRLMKVAEARPERLVLEPVRKLVAGGCVAGRICAG